MTPTAEELEAMQAEWDSEERDGGAQSIEALADEPERFDEEEADDTPYIEGTHGQLSLAVGGRKPDSSTFKVKSAEVQVREAQFHKGETVELRVIARIDEVKFIDVHDAYGTVTATKRVHSAKPISVERVGDAEE